jgi:hypothetical protein
MLVALNLVSIVVAGSNIRGDKELAPVKLNPF